MGESSPAGGPPDRRTVSHGPDGMRRLIVGCGYLGTRVARRWLETGDHVYAITRSPIRAPAMVADGIVPVVANLADGPSSTALETLRGLPAFDTIFWAVGFDRAGGSTYRNVHVDGLACLLGAVTGSPRVILSSSTGVWSDEGGCIVTEDTPTHPGREAGHVLVEAESLLRDHAIGPGVALRFAGLYGPGRLPRLDDLRAGRPIAADPDSWLNLVHVDDAASVVCAVAAMASPGPLYVVSDGHPILRRDWYGHLARLTGSPQPSWDPSLPRTRGADKRVDPSRLFRELPITFSHPDPLQGITSVLRDS